jgi:hypothetical protein
MDKDDDLTLFQCKLSKPTCDHQWPDNDGAGVQDSDRCEKCGLGFLAYVHMEAP